MIRLLLCLFIFGLSHGAAAQNNQTVDINPGDALVRGTAIESYSARWRQWVTSPDGTERVGINTIYDSVSVDVFSDTTGVIVRDVLWEATNSTYHRVDLLDRGSLAPIRMHVRTSPHAVTHVDFEGGHLRGLSISDPLQPTRHTEVDIGQLAFTWSSDGFLLAALLLPDGADIRLPVVNNVTHSPSVGSMTFRVIGRERIDTTPFGSHDAVVVKQMKSASYWGQYWISERAPYVVRVQFTQQDGTVTRWELF